MPYLPPVYLTDEEYDKFREVCKSFDCSSYALRKVCILVGLKNFDQIKEEVKKVKSGKVKNENPM